MYFHLIWIKEKNWKQYEIDLIVYWNDENIIHDFVSNRWIVIVSLSLIKDELTSYWNIVISILYESNIIKLFLQWDDLEQTVYFIETIWLHPETVDFVDNHISDEEMKSIIQNVSTRIHTENEEIKLKQQEEEIKERQKYEEKSVQEWLKAINNNIDKLTQIMKAWEGILSTEELKTLEDLSNDMKKIRLWTNFNKMAELVLESHILIKKSEEQIFNAPWSQKFSIGKHSAVTNVDVLSELFTLDKSNEKSLFKPQLLTLSENIYSKLWKTMVYLQLLRRDIINAFSKASFEDFFYSITNIIEQIVLLSILIITILRLIGPMIWLHGLSIYLLPALGRLWLLIYLLNNIEITSRTFKILAFIVLVIIYRYGLKLLLNTFAL